MRCINAFVFFNNQYKLTSEVVARNLFHFHKKIVVPLNFPGILLGRVRVSQEDGSLLLVKLRGMIFKATASVMRVMEELVVRTHFKLTFRHLLASMRENLWHSRL